MARLYANVKSVKKFGDMAKSSYLCSERRKRLTARIAKCRLQNSIWLKIYVLIAFILFDDSFIG